MSFEELSDKLEDFINEVLDPFNNLIKKKELNVKIIKQTEDNISIVINWKDYQLILFHVVQNAVKYNITKGLIEIIYSVEKGAS